MKFPKLVVVALALAAATSAPQAAVISFFTILLPEGGGGRTGSGSAYVAFDDVTNKLTYSGSFTGLSGTLTVAHFHCCTATPFTGTAGVAVDTPTLSGFPIGVSSGTFGDTLALDDPNNFNPAFVTSSGGTTALATARLLNGFRNDTAYLNIHSTTFTGGEIRGFMSVPEPASLALALFALVALGSVRGARKTGT